MALEKARPTAESRPRNVGVGFDKTMTKSDVEASKQLSKLKNSIGKAEAT